jgi:hypothetical protein
MHSHRDFWLWAGTALTAFALTLLAVAGGLLAARDDYDFWRSAPMLAAYVCGALALFCFGAAVREVPFPFGRTEPLSQLPQVVKGKAPQRQAVTAQRVFDEAPPELAEMSPASLKELFAGRTQAQGEKLTEQHVGKPVRVSGEVDSVQRRPIPAVTLKSSVLLFLYFDADDYDAEPLLLTLNKGDRIIVSGQVHRFTEASVSLDRCNLIEARRVS